MHCFGKSYLNYQSTELLFPVVEWPWEKRAQHAVRPVRVSLIGVENISRCKFLGACVFLCGGLKRTRRKTGLHWLLFGGGDGAVLSGDYVWLIDIQKCIKCQSGVWSVEYRKLYGNVPSLHIQKKKKVTLNSQIKCWKFWTGRELLKYFRGVVRSKDCRIKKWRGNECGVMHTTLSYFSLLSENVIFEIKTCVCLPRVFMDAGVFNLVCDYEKIL